MRQHFTVEVRRTWSQDDLMLRIIHVICAQERTRCGPILFVQGSSHLLQRKITPPTPLPSLKHALTIGALPSAGLQDAAHLRARRLLILIPTDAYPREARGALRAMHAVRESVRVAGSARSVRRLHSRYRFTPASQPVSTLSVQPECECPCDK